MSHIYAIIWIAIFQDDPDLLINNQYNTVMSLVDIA